MACYVVKNKHNFIFKESGFDSLQEQRGDFFLRLRVQTGSGAQPACYLGGAGVKAADE